MEATGIEMQSGRLAASAIGIWPPNDGVGGPRADRGSTVTTVAVISHNSSTVLVRYGTVR